MPAWIPPFLRASRLGLIERIAEKIRIFSLSELSVSRMKLTSGSRIRVRTIANLKAISLSTPPGWAGWAWPAAGAGTGGSGTRKKASHTSAIAAIPDDVEQHSVCPSNRKNRLPSARQLSQPSSHR